MGAQNFNFATKFPLNGVLSPHFAFLNENFPTSTKFFDDFPTAQNLGGGIASLTPASMLMCSTIQPLRQMHLGVSDYFR